MANASRADRNQQWVFLLMGLLPGILFYLKTISAQQAALLVMVCYVLSRLHSSRLQKQSVRELEEAEQKQRQEAERIAALPGKKRKNILKGLARKETTPAGETSVPAELNDQELQANCGQD